MSVFLYWLVFFSFFFVYILFIGFDFYFWGHLDFEGVLNEFVGLDLFLLVLWTHFQGTLESLFFPFHVPHDFRVIGLFVSGIGLEEEVKPVFDGIFISANNFLGDPWPLLAVFQKITNQRIILFWTPVSSTVNLLLLF